jgi:hypothetical protein
MQKIVDTQHPSAEYLAGRNWVDRALPSGGHAAVLLSSFGDRFTTAAMWWDVSFWNVRADRALRFDSGDDFIQKTTYPLNLDQRDGSLDGIGTDYVVLSDTDGRLAFARSQPITGRYGMHLVRLPPDPHVRWAVLGTDPAGRLAAGGRANVLLFAAPAGDVVLRLSAKQAAHGYRLVAGTRRVRLPRGATRTVRIRVPAARPGRPAQAVVTVSGRAPVDPALDPGPEIDVVRVPGG